MRELKRIIEDPVLKAAAQDEREALRKDLFGARSERKRRVQAAAGQLLKDVQALLEDEVGVVDVRDNLGSIKGEIALQPNREAFR